MAEALIYKAISAVMDDVGAVGKNNVNEQQKYKFRGIDDVMNALSPAMVKNKVFCTPTVLDMSREERTNRNGTTLIYSVLTVKYTFYTTDGSSVETVVVGEAMDSGDKSLNKAMSACFKYACFQTFCIPTEEMHDSEENTYEVAPKKSNEKVAKKSDYSETPAEKKKNDEMKDAVDPVLVPNGDIASKKARIAEELKRTGLDASAICGAYKTDSIDKMTEAQMISAITRLAKSKSK